MGKLPPLPVRAEDSKLVQPSQDSALYVFFFQAWKPAATRFFFGGRMLSPKFCVARWSLSLLSSLLAP